MSNSHRFHFFRTGLAGSLGDGMRLFFVSMLGACLGLMIPAVMPVTFDWIVPQGTSGFFLQVAAALITAALARALLNWVAQRAILRLHLRLENHIVLAAWKYVHHLPVRILRQTPPVETAMQLESLREMLDRMRGILQIAAWAVPVMIASLIWMAITDLSFATVGTIFALGSVVMIGLLNARRSQWLEHAFIHERQLAGRVNQWVRLIGKIRSTNAQDEIFALWKKTFIMQTQWQYRAAQGEIIAAALTSGYLGLSSALLFACVSRTELTIGAFLSFAAAYGLLVTALQALAKSWPTMTSCMALARPAVRLLNEPPEVNESHQDPGVMKGEIEFQQVAFRYSDAEAPLFKELSFHIHPGEFVAISGKSGEGKSTLFRLMLGFESPDTGKILYNGKSIATLNPEKLRSQIGIVMQQPTLFAGDLFRNIVGESELTLSDAWRAAEAAGIADEIRALPMQMFTLVSESGRNFSFGQRQRIALARALVRQPKILLLDEATSALDAPMQGSILTYLQSLPITRVLISHRQSALSKADRILSLSQKKRL